ncbi:hypothetical protein LguiA_007045 [Lonicera macranthoides]
MEDAYVLYLLKQFFRYELNFLSIHPPQVGSPSCQFHFISGCGTDRRLRGVSATPTQELPMGGAALDLIGVSLLEETLSVAKQFDGVLLVAIKSNIQMVIISVLNRYILLPCDGLKPIQTDTFVTVETVTKVLCCDLKKERRVEMLQRPSRPASH